MRVVSVEVEEGVEIGMGNSSICVKVSSASTTEDVARLIGNSGILFISEISSDLSNNVLLIDPKIMHPCTFRN